MLWTPIQRKIASPERSVQGIRVFNGPRQNVERRIGMRRPRRLKEVVVRRVISGSGGGRKRARVGV